MTDASADKINLGAGFAIVWMSFVATILFLVATSPAEDTSKIEQRKEQRAQFEKTCNDLGGLVYQSPLPSKHLACIKEDVIDVPMEDAG